MMAAGIVQPVEIMSDRAVDNPPKGCGRSGAEWIVTWLQCYQDPAGASPTLNNSTSALLPAAYTPGILHDYRHMVAQTKPKQLPSGADIVAQMCGGYTLFQAHSAVTSGPKFATMQWPSSLAWLIIQTGHTMSTDQALQANLPALAPLVALSQALQALLQANPSAAKRAPNAQIPMGHQADSEHTASHVHKQAVASRAMASEHAVQTPWPAQGDWCLPPVTPMQIMDAQLWRSVGCCSA